MVRKESNQTNKQTNQRRSDGTIVVIDQCHYMITQDRRQSKTLPTIDELGSKIDTVFLIAHCRQCGDKWQS